MVGEGGLPAGSVVQAIHPVAAAVAMLAAMLVGIVIATGTARLVTPLSGLCVLGAAMGWAGLWLDGTRDIIVHGQPALLAADGFAWTVLVLLTSWSVIGLGRQVSDVHPVEVGEPPDPLRSRDALVLLVSGAAALPVVWFAASTDLRGQTVCAAVVGGMAAGVVGRLWSPHVQPILAPAGVVLAGTIGGWINATSLPADALAAWAGGDIPSLLLLTPIDWAVGGLLGAPLGYRIGGSFITHEGESVQA